MEGTGGAGDEADAILLADWFLPRIQVREDLARIKEQLES